MSIPLAIWLSAEPPAPVEEAVERLQEYGNALTGKIDVRAVKR